MIKANDYSKHGTIGTIVIHGSLFLLLFFCGMKAFIPEDGGGGGLTVNFGDGDTGMGMEEPSPSKGEPNEVVVASTTPPPAKIKASTSPVEKEEINTQDYEESVALKTEQKKKAEKERLAKDAQRKEELEAKRIRDEQLQQQKAAEAAEKKKQDEIARQAAEVQSRVKSGFGGKGTGATSSEGIAGGTGNQGYVTGDPNSKNRVGGGSGNGSGTGNGNGIGNGNGNGSGGSGYSLAGRSLVGSLPKPSYNNNEEGVVVVEIVVDSNGTVISANPILKGTTTQDSYLRKSAVEAAYKAKFNTATKTTNNQKGTITYHFTLN